MTRYTAKPPAYDAQNDMYRPVRLSHLLRHCSVGSVVRTPDYLLTIKDIREWKTPQGTPSGRVIPYVEQVKLCLGITQDLREPPIAALKEDNRVEGCWLPAQIFPETFICQKCHLLYHKPWRLGKTLPLMDEIPTSSMHRAQKKAHDFHCTALGCKAPLAQVTLINIHQDGHMAEVPWHWWVHYDPKNGEKAGSRCIEAKAAGRPYLQWNRQTNQVTCTVCNVHKSIRAGQSCPIFDNSQPWIFADRQMKDAQNNASQIDVQEPTAALPAYDKTPAKTSASVPGLLMEVNDTRVHTAVNKSALVIPPESRVRRGGVVDRLYCDADLRKTLTHDLVHASAFQIRSAKNDAARRLNCDIPDLEQALTELKKGYPLYGQTLPAGQLLHEEYKALTNMIPNLQDDEDFVTRSMTSAWHDLIEQAQIEAPNRLLYRLGGLIDQVVSVVKLKEILVFTGFSRGGEGQRSHATDDNVDNDSSDKNAATVLSSVKPQASDNHEPATPVVVPPAIVGDIGWLPALELYGEGLFLTLNEAVLAAWEQLPQVRARVDILRKRFVAAEGILPEEIVVTPRFLLLHALSHLLIKELESQAGYSAASLKEKIYSAEDLTDSMAGILIYVAIPDVNGSLGGLAELAEPKRLARLLVRVFEKAQWCSLDPVCSSHSGQGPGLLNLAACHACMLLPETSCFCGNRLLDRQLVRGNSQQKLPGILDMVKLDGRFAVDSSGINHLMP